MLEGLEEVVLHNYGPEITEYSLKINQGCKFLQGFSYFLTWWYILQYIETLPIHLNII